MGFTVKKRKKIMKAITKLFNAEIIVRAIAALGYAPITVPSSIANGICMLPASHEPLDSRLHRMASQFGLRWELHTDLDLNCYGNTYGVWILES